MEDAGHVVERLADLDAPLDQVGARGVDVVDRQLQALERARRGRRQARAEDDRARRPRWRQLHHPVALVDREVGVEPPAQRLVEAPSPGRRPRPGGPRPRAGTAPVPPAGSRSRSPARLGAAHPRLLRVGCIRERTTPRRRCVERARVTTCSRPPAPSRARSAPRGAVAGAGEGASWRHAVVPGVRLRRRAGPHAGPRGGPRRSGRAVPAGAGHRRLPRPGVRVARRRGGPRPARRRGARPRAAPAVRPAQHVVAGRATTPASRPWPPPPSGDEPWWSCWPTSRTTTGGATDWPVAVVAESPDDRSVVFRTYCSQWPVDGRRHVRPPVLRAERRRPPGVVGRFQTALAGGDVDAVMSAFADDAYLREPFGPHARPPRERRAARVLHDEPSARAAASSSSPAP